jgi:hypothetical protein
MWRCGDLFYFLFLFFSSILFRMYVCTSEYVRRNLPRMYVVVRALG